MMSNHQSENKIQVKNYSTLHLSQLVLLLFKLSPKLFGAMHSIYYINRSIATKVDLTYLG